MIEEADNGSREEKKSHSDSSTPVLDNFSRDLIKFAEEGKLDPVVGREREITRIAQILSRRKKNNPIILGEPGCGKTAIVEGLANMIYNGDCPRNLMDKRIVSLDMGSIVAGTKYRGQFEERMKVIIEEIQSDPNIILFIDEIHTIVGAGNSSGSLDASNIFKPALARGEIQCVGATTLDEYRKNFEKDGALERRFQKVIVDASTKEETLTILTNIKDKYEDYHKVIYSDEILKLCVDLADRYVTDREFPDKAIDIIDEVGARCQVDVKLPEIIERLKVRAHTIKNEKMDVVKKQDYEKAANLRDKERRILHELENEKGKFEVSLETNKKIVPVDLVYEVVSNMTKIPISKLNSDETRQLTGLENTLNKKVIGQSEAVKKISKSIRRNRLGIKDPNKPIGSFIFLGSTGVGKTHLAKELAKEMFGSVDSMIRVDMSEYQEKHTISRLIGSPPGYVGHDEGGQLTEQVKNKPYSVILFDEIEKANKDIFATLLQVLDDGHLTDGLGRKINFKNCVIIMTSNIGVKKLQDFGSGIGFQTGDNNYIEEERRADTLKKELKKFFAPEFLNRIDDVIIFNSLGKDEVKHIIQLEMDKLSVRLSEMKYYIEFDKTIIQMLSEIGYDTTYGARPIKRAIQDKLEDFISEEVLVGNITVEEKYTLISKDGEVKIKPKRGRVTKKGGK
jgi:ATP-dependent Clp protease ATP-binding subunit ClpC|tara:strand:+ start:5672 stop:7708 length:2037 start_codon:yes stop_codon:yes gene_type:complete